jgi:hypothetical protein
MHVIVVHLELTFFLMLVQVLGVLVALLGSVLALWSMRRAWLERLVAAIRRSLVLLFLLVLIVVAVTTAVFAILPLVVVSIVLIALPVVATVTPAMSFRDMADLLVILLA